MKKAVSWNAERLERWEKVRAKGMRRFIRVHGVLQWGGFMYFFSLAVFQHSRYGDVFSTEGNLPFRLILAALVWAFVGYLYGKSRWRRNEAEYKEQRAQRPSA